MKAFLLSLAGLAGLALATTPALAHGPSRDYRRGHHVVRHHSHHRHFGHRKAYGYPTTGWKYYQDHCNYPPARYCPPPCVR